MTLHRQRIPAGSADLTVTVVQQHFRRVLDKSYSSRHPYNPLISELKEPELSM